MTRPEEAGERIDPADIDAAATLMTLLHSTERPARVRELVADWDMLQAGPPSREELEAAAAVLVGSGLAQLDVSWGVRLTEAGARLRNSVPGRTAMRRIPCFLQQTLHEHRLERADLHLSREAFDAALADHLGRARLRAERGVKKNRWWWRTPSRRG
jgi:hypothetical protein